MDRAAGQNNKYGYADEAENQIQTPSAERFQRPPPLLSALATRIILKTVIG